MRRHQRQTLLRIMGLSILLWGPAMAQDAPRPSPHHVPVVRQPAAVVLPPRKSSYLPGMPYPYPRIHVNPIVPISPAPDSEAGERPRPEVRYGYLRLEITPAEAEIYLDGHFIGHSKDFSGSAMLPVWPGGHRLDFRAGDLGHHMRVFVTAGETIALSHDLSPRPPERPTPAVRRWTTPPRRQSSP